MVCASMKPLSVPTEIVRRSIARAHQTNYSQCTYTAPKCNNFFEFFLISVRYYRAMWSIHMNSFVKNLCMSRRVSVHTRTHGAHDRSASVNLKLCRSRADTIKCIYCEDCLGRMFLCVHHTVQLELVTLDPTVRRSAGTPHSLQTPCQDSTAFQIKVELRRMLNNRRGSAPTTMQSARSIESESKSC
jgi:hypothetical protein